MTQRAELPKWNVCGERFNAHFGVTDADWKRGRDKDDTRYLLYPDHLPAPDQIFARRDALEAKEAGRPPRHKQAQAILSANPEAVLDALLGNTTKLLAAVNAANYTLPPKA